MLRQVVVVVAVLAVVPRPALAQIVPQIAPLATSVDCADNDLFPPGERASVPGGSVTAAQIAGLQVCIRELKLAVEATLASDKPAVQRTPADADQLSELAKALADQSKALADLAAKQAAAKAAGEGAKAGNAARSQGARASRLRRKTEWSNRFT